MPEFVNKDYTEAIEALESGMLDTSDLASYMDIILHALYVCRNQDTEVEVDDLKMTSEEEEERLMKSIKNFMYQATPTVIKSCPYLLPCGSCDKRAGELCSQYK